MQQPVKKSDPTGGIRRELPADIQALIPAPKLPEINNTCPQCGAHALATDSFCRKDGTRLVMGKQCLGCGAPEESADEFCWQCGLKAGEKPAPPPPPMAAEEVQDRIEAIRELARKKGLLKETLV